MEMHLMVVLSNAEPGRDEEFNRWYDEQHVPDTVQKLDSIVSGRRYRRLDLQGAPSHPFRYLAVYEIPDDELDSARQQFVDQRAERVEALAAGREPLIPVSDAISPDVLVGFFAPTGTPVVGGSARERR
ncbi:MAG: hypothetical protein CMH83_21225 [Nocardioides sp.]|nr:hypothetical protein [Nocardioides sp.]